MAEKNSNTLNLRAREKERESRWWWGGGGGGQIASASEAAREKGLEKVDSRSRDGK